MKLPPRDRPLPEVLAAAGIDPEAIDIVVNTHLHWDHCGGNTILTPDGPAPAFPRAVYYTRRGEWEHAHARHPRDSIQLHRRHYDPLGGIRVHVPYRRRPRGGAGGPGAAGFGGITAT